MGGAAAALQRDPFFTLSIDRLPFPGRVGLYFPVKLRTLEFAQFNRLPRGRNFSDRHAFRSGRFVGNPEYERKLPRNPSIRSLYDGHWQ